MKNYDSEREFIRIIGEIGVSLGLNRSVGQIYGLLYLSEKPMSLDTIVEKLKVSKGNVSLNIRELKKWGAVKNVWVQGSRRDFYEAKTDFVDIIYKRVRSRLENIINTVELNLTVFETKNSFNKTQKERLKHIKEMNSSIKTILENSPKEISAKQLAKVSSMTGILKKLF